MSNLATLPIARSLLGQRGQKSEEKIEAAHRPRYEASQGIGLNQTTCFEDQGRGLRRRIVTLVTSGHVAESLGKTSETVTNTKFTLASNIPAVFDNLK